MLNTFLATVTAKQIESWPKGAQIAFIVAQIIAMIGFMLFFWLAYTCERDLKRLRKALEDEGKIRKRN